MAKDKKILSASRIKTLETCSWSYYCNYELKLPQRQNEGALRGTIAHLVFELILKDRHKHHKKLILDSNALEGSASINTLVLKHLKRDQNLHDLPMASEENYELMNKMIIVGLRSDFFGEGGKVVDPEKEFLIDSKSPKYRIRGFMDKPIMYEKEKQIKIVDYKSSKYKFRGEELTANIQAMAYSLAAKKLWPKYKPFIEFLFLRFPKSAQQQCKYTNEQLNGFEYFLEKCYEQINSFTEEDAKSNYAKDGKSSWMCKAGKTWRCPYLDSFTYYQILDKKGNVVDRSLKKVHLRELESGEKLKELHYAGCPAHKEKPVQDIDDWFDF
jgi:ATP-dependent helicase/DNAse subunit B